MQKMAFLTMKKMWQNASVSIRSCVSGVRTGRKNKLDFQIILTIQLLQKTLAFCSPNTVAYQETFQQPLQNFTIKVKGFFF